MGKTLLVIFLFLNIFILSAHESYDFKSLYLSLTTSYMELKDDINFGLTYIGPDAIIGFGYKEKDENKIINYEFSFGAGGKLFSESWGFRWEISPADFSYSFNILNKEKVSLYLGPGLNIKYGIQNYPDMHSGWLNWMTSYNLGINTEIYLKIGKGSFKVQFRNSLLSLTSRPELERDQYYFSLELSDIISDTHSNMSLTPFFQYLETGLNVEMLLGENHTLALDLQYNGYFIEPLYKELFFSIKYTYFFKGAE